MAEGSWALWGVAARRLGWWIWVLRKQPSSFPGEFLLSLMASALGALGLALALQSWLVAVAVPRGAGAPGRPSPPLGVSTAQGQ